MRLYSITLAHSLPEIVVDLACPDRSSQPNFCAFGLIRASGAHSCFRVIPAVLAWFYSISRAASRRLAWRPSPHTPHH